jgi:hypothetical protein
MTDDTPYRRFLNVRDKERDDGQSDETFLEIREALIDGLAAYSKDEVRTNFNSEMAFYLHEAFQANFHHAHPLFHVARGRGNQGLELNERKCVEDAVRYIKAAREGVIGDSNPIDTVIIKYTREATEATLDVRTVERWLDREDMLAVDGSAMDADLIRATMLYSARYYGRECA